MAICTNKQERLANYLLIKLDLMKYFDFEIHGTLKNANYIDDNGLFVGNHHYPIPDAIEALAAL